MHRRLAYLLAWSVAATITVGVAWLGIRSVLAAAAPTRTVPLSAAELRRVAPAPPDASSSADSSASSSSSSSSETTSAAPPPQPTVSGGPASGTASGSPSAAPSGWQRDGTGFRRVFHTVGGDADFFMTKDAVQVTSSTPRPGYTVNVTRYGTDSVMVSFFGDRKTSRVWVRWWNGPYGEITESVD